MLFVRARTDAANRIERITLSVVIVFLGMFLTFMTGSLAPPDGMVNPFWGSVFGIGFWIEFAMFGSIPYGALGLLWGLIGIILWPIVVLVLFAKLVGRIQRSGSILVALSFYAALAITLVYNVPVSSIQDSSIENLPIFVRYLDFAPR